MLNSMMFIERKPPTPRRIRYPGRVPFLALAALHLKGDAAAVAAEPTAPPVHHDRASGADRRAESNDCTGFRLGAHPGWAPAQACAACPAMGTMPRPRVIMPRARMQLPASDHAAPPPGRRQNLANAAHHQHRREGSQSKRRHGKDAGEWPGSCSPLRRQKHRPGDTAESR